MTGKLADALAAAVVVLASAVAAYCVLLISASALRQSAHEEMLDYAERSRAVTRDLKQAEAADRPTLKVKLAEQLAYQRGALAAGEKAALASKLAAAPAMAAGALIAAVGFLALRKRGRARTRAATMMDSACAGAHRLSDSGAFRVEGGRLTIAREGRPDDVCDLQDLRLALAQLLAGPGEQLEIDAMKIEYAPSQFLGAFVEVALQAKEKGKRLRIVTNESLGRLMDMIGLQHLAEVQVKGAAEAPPEGP